MTNEERWNTFISELKAYIAVHHLGPSKHTDLYNQCRYYRKKAKAWTLDEEKAKELECVLGLRDLNIHTGGRDRDQEGQVPVISILLAYSSRADRR